MMADATPVELTPKQEAFVHAYLRTGNQSEACVSGVLDIKAS